MPKPKFIRKTRDKDLVFSVWCKRAKRIETLMGDGEDMERTFEIAYLLFPLIDSISFTLFDTGGYKYLEEMGLSSSEASLVMKVFRNGYVHNFQSYDIKYDDGKVIWGVLSSGGTGGLRPFDFGYKDREDPTYNIEGDKVIDYIKTDNSISLASLHLDRLLALLIADLKKRKKEYPDETIDIIVGQVISGKKPKHT